ncbi:glycosyl hydrolase family 28-related protein [Candidimonas humi]|nr:right-handed parallel beta-helix repeat-containing protein [Candidimonas humi]
MKRRSFITNAVAALGGVWLGGMHSAAEAADAGEGHNPVSGVPAAHLSSLLKGEQDATEMMQQAINNYSRIVLPEGRFAIDTRTLVLRDGVQIVGAGQGRTIIQSKGTFGAFGILGADSGNGDVARNLKNIKISDLTIDGHVEELGYQPFTHLLSLHGVSDALIERVAFIGFRGDGIYLGSGVRAKQERHNLRVTIRDCVFDGIAKRNRNGLSCMDCDTLLVENSVFRNIGNPALSASVGAIDFEPNSKANIYRNVLIRNCKFSNIDTKNTAAITFFNGMQSGDNIKKLSVEDCTFENCYRGINASSKRKRPSSPADDVSVSNCHFSNSLVSDISLGGMSGVKIEGCSFESTPGNKSAKGGIVIGRAGKNCINAINWHIVNCTFASMTPSGGLFDIFGARGLEIRGNKLSDIAGVIFNFPPDKSSGSGRYLSDISISGNSISSGNKMGRAVTPFLFRIADDINSGGTNSLINSACRLSNNSFPSSIRFQPGGSKSALESGLALALPTSGTWYAGARVQVQRDHRWYVCSQPGTFGSLGDVTGDVSASSKLVANVRDPGAALRAGQVITVGDSQRHVVAAVDEDKMTLELDRPYAGKTMRAEKISWIPPVFKPQ